MGSKYVIGYNPFQDFLMQSIYYGADLSNRKIKVDIHSAFAFILQNVLDNQNDVVHLDFEIIGDKNSIKIVGKNAVSAVWLSGVFPDNIDLLLKKNVFRIGNRIYRYNKKTKELTYKVNKDNKI